MNWKNVILTGAVKKVQLLSSTSGREMTQMAIGSSEHARRSEYACAEPKRGTARHDGMTSLNSAIKGEGTRGNFQTFVR